MPVLSQSFEPRPESSESPIIFVVNCDAAERESLESFIYSNGWQPQTFASVEKFLCQPSSVVPSCLILNASQDCHSLEVQKRLMLERPEVPIILATSYVDVRMVVQAIKAGAIEFLTKPFIDDLLVSAIRQALDRSRANLARQTQMRALKECYVALTPREREVMALVASGMLNKEVGAELDISERTVKGHRGRMMQKMKANSLAELVKMAARLRLPAPSRSTISFSNLASTHAVA